MASSSYEMVLVERISNRPKIPKIFKKKQELDVLTGSVEKKKLLAQMKQQLISGPLKQNQQECKAQLEDWRAKYIETNAHLFRKLKYLDAEKKNRGAKIELLLDKLMNQSKTELETKVMADEIRKMEGQIQMMKKRKNFKKNVSHSPPLTFKECGNNIRRFL